MEKLSLRCYAVFSTFVILFLVGYAHHGTQEGREQIAETVEQSAVLSGEPLPSKSKSPIDEGVWAVVRVVDGDTLIVGDGADKNKQYQVRLIGADTPEVVKSGTPIEPFGIEASEFTKRMIADADNQVRLSFDGEQLDKYKRTLAMVYVSTPAGEVWLNELLIREGLAHARLDYRYSHMAKLAFAVAEVEARREKLNLWRDVVE